VITQQIWPAPAGWHESLHRPDSATWLLGLHEPGEQAPGRTVRITAWEAGVWLHSAGYDLPPECVTALVHVAVRFGKTTAARSEPDDGFRQLTLF